MDVEKVLTAVGIEGSRAAFYLAALELGEASVQEVASRAGIGRTGAYDVMARLIEQGLISHVEVDGKMRVIAEEPGALLRRADQQVRMIDEIMPDLRSLYNRSRSKPRIRYFEGVEGIRSVIWDTLNCRSGVLRATISMSELLETPGRAVMDRYIADRIEMGLTLRVIRSRTRDTESIWSSSADEKREVRYAPEGKKVGMTIYLYDDKVLFISSKKEYYAMVLQSSEFYELQETMFESLWDLSTPA